MHQCDHFVCLYLKTWWVRFLLFPSPIPFKFKNVVNSSPAHHHVFKYKHTKWSHWCITASLNYKNTMINRITMETVACLRSTFLNVIWSKNYQLYYSIEDLSKWPHYYIIFKINIICLQTFWEKKFNMQDIALNNFLHDLLKYHCIFIV
jgi:hypothetical protein